MKDKFNFMHPTGYKELTKIIYQEPLQDTDYRIFKIEHGSQKTFFMTFNTNYINQEQISHDILKMLWKNGISFLMSDIHKPFTTIEQIDITIQEIMGEHGL